MKEKVIKQIRQKLLRKYHDCDYEIGTKQGCLLRDTLCCDDTEMLLWCQNDEFLYNLLKQELLTIEHLV